MASTRPEPLMTATDVAEWLEYTPAALAQMRYAGTGPKFIKIGGHAVRYRRSDVEEWLDAQTCTSTGTKAAAR